MSHEGFMKHFQRIGRINRNSVEHQMMDKLNKLQHLNSYHKVVQELYEECDCGEPIAILLHRNNHTEMPYPILIDNPKDLGKIMDIIALNVTEQIAKLKSEINETQL